MKELQVGRIYIKEKGESGDRIYIERGMMKGKGRWRGRRFLKYRKGDRVGDGGERRVRKKGTDREEKIKSRLGED